MEGMENIPAPCWNRYSSVLLISEVKPAEPFVKTSHCIFHKNNKHKDKVKETRYAHLSK